MYKSLTNIRMAYELYLATVHCIGRLSHVVEVVDTQAEAETWVRGEERNGQKPLTVLREDPIVWCPVKHCHMKRQKPVRNYRELLLQD